MQEIASQALKSCPYLKRTSVQKLRQLSTISVPKLKGINSPATALLQIATKCPVMSSAIRQISTSSKCPYASVVDNIAKIGNPGSVDEFLKLQKGQFKLFDAQKSGVFDYESFYNEELDKKKNDRSYRYFNNINRLAQQFPKAHTGTGDKVTVWCSNDYLGMSKHPKVLEAMRYFY